LGALVNDSDKDAIGTLQKVCKLALDPDTPTEESKAAWLVALKLIRARGWKSLEAIAGFFGTPVRPDDFFKQKVDDVPYGWEFEMPFGKHQGDTLGVIARTDRSYIEWLSGQELRNGHLRKAIDSVAAWCEENPDEA
jgi:hypothetical protein